MESAEKERLFIEKSRVVIAWKKPNERASFVIFFGRQRTGLKVLIKVASKADIDGKESFLGQESRIYCHHNVEHKQHFVKDGVQWLNQKLETAGISLDGRITPTGRK